MTAVEPSHQNAPATARSLIIDFVEAIRSRGEPETESPQRSVRRYHRSWPLGVSWNGPGGGDICVALHDASYQGVSFLCDHRFEVGGHLFVRLFWHDDTAPAVPAVVRHATPTPNGYLVGCEFNVGE